jgi:DMSO reductase anchor subunit
MRVKRGLLALALTGFLFVALGAALFTNAARLAGAIDPNDLRESAQASSWGTVMVALGAGSLVASLLLARIARAWGLLPAVVSQGHDSGEE